ncbi:3D domain-containing protein [Bacillus sp. UNC438CL73TsuS30]|uniref:3D domain-containing protein n=1 Tax=Bacillus sp. UNC438CL73TsuS30 TaxID=1340434 RepID=UPI000479D453|nr:3D domain-containing protein [Bacillus sp. UNC438CL73TsuS30]
MKKFLTTISLAAFLLLAHNSGASAASNTYTVKKGDSLYKISRTTHVSITNLKNWNHLKSDVIHPNQKLKIIKPATSNVTKAKTSKTVKKSSSKVTVKKSQKVVKTITVSASAYTVNCAGCSGKTYTGLNLKKNPNLKVISVDPRVIPLGSKVYVEGYGYAIAADKGSAIKGKEIDVFMPTYKKAIQWGRKTVKVKILK